MLIINAGNKHVGDFHFKCKCGCEWFAERQEVSFTPPCIEYDVYMRCPNCKEVNWYIHE